MKTKIARTLEDLDKVFKLRYQVYVEEEQKYGGFSFVEKKLKDEFDDRPDTINLLLLKDGEAIGAVRFVGSKTVNEKLPSDKLYDFSNVRMDNAGLIPGSIGMLVIRKAYRNSRIFTALMVALCKKLLKGKQHYYMFILNHECSNLFSRIMGAKMISAKYWSTEICNFIIPMILYKHQILKYIQRYEDRESYTYKAA